MRAILFRTSGKADDGPFPKESVQRSFQEGPLSLRRITDDEERIEMTTCAADIKDGRHGPVIHLAKVLKDPSEIRFRHGFSAVRKSVARESTIRFVDLPAKKSSLWEEKCSFQKALRRLYRIG